MITKPIPGPSPDPNYESQSDTIEDIINPAAAHCSISGYSGIYDGQSHGLSGSCAGIASEPVLDRLAWA